MGNKMPVTENEAKTKWCPFARSYDAMTDEGLASGVNRAGVDKPDGWCMCLGSRCMAWHWSENPVYDKKIEYVGYCGLVGL
jgi:hypothetical protein